jgi:hypothetical protein
MIIISWTSDELSLSNHQALFSYFSVKASEKNTTKTHKSIFLTNYYIVYDILLSIHNTFFDQINLQNTFSPTKRRYTNFINHQYCSKKYKMHKQSIMRSLFERELLLKSHTVTFLFFLSVFWSALISRNNMYNVLENLPLELLLS